MEESGSKIEIPGTIKEYCEIKFNEIEGIFKRDRPSSMPVSDNGAVAASVPLPAPKAKKRRKRRERPGNKVKTSVSDLRSYLDNYFNSSDPPTFNDGAAADTPAIQPVPKSRRESNQSVRNELGVIAAEIEDNEDFERMAAEIEHFERIAAENVDFPNWDQYLDSIADTPATDVSDDEVVAVAASAAPPLFRRDIGASSQSTRRETERPKENSPLPDWNKRMDNILRSLPTYSDNGAAAAAASAAPLAPERSGMVSSKSAQPEDKNSPRRSNKRKAGPSTSAWDSTYDTSRSSGKKSRLDIHGPLEIALYDATELQQKAKNGVPPTLPEMYGIRDKFALTVISLTAVKDPKGCIEKAKQGYLNWSAMCYKKKLHDAIIDPSEMTLSEAREKSEALNASATLLARTDLRKLMKIVDQPPKPTPENPSIAEEAGPAAVTRF